MSNERAPLFVYTRYLFYTIFILHDRAIYLLFRLIYLLLTILFVYIISFYFTPIFIYYYPYLSFIICSIIYLYAYYFIKYVPPLNLFTPPIIYLLFIIYLLAAFIYTRLFDITTYSSFYYVPYLFY
jgi:hypothetical protein